ncbi:MAG: hypothetical protein KAG94_00580 [Clostridiales bacterium]|nr:hypothetical protein [Clostridiales bacterium]
MSVKIIELLIEYEMTISKLYDVCAKNFPELEFFFRELSNEEIIHASIIKGVSDKIDNKTIFLNEKRFHPRPVEISIEYAQNITKRIAEGDLDLIGALSLAYDIESSVIESQYYQVFAGKSAEFNRYLKQVRDESSGHRKRIRDMKQKVFNEPLTPIK